MSDEEEFMQGIARALQLDIKLIEHAYALQSGLALFRGCNRFTQAFDYQAIEQAFHDACKLLAQPPLDTLYLLNTGDRAVTRAFLACLGKQDAIK
jgi:hypothetical protein